MASESGFYTAAEICEMIEHDDGNPEYPYIPFFLNWMLYLVLT